MRPTRPLLFVLAIGSGPALAEPPAPTGRDALVEGSAAFALDLHRALSKSGGNVVFSPHSVSTCLAMVREGARGETRTQMDRVLRLPADSAAAYRELLAEIGNVRMWGPEDARVPSYSLSQANAVFAQRDFAIEDAFRASLASSFSAEPRLVDFRAAPEAARSAINDWVAASTKDRIRDLFPPGTVDARTRLVLANAVHFKADWSSPFWPGATDDRPFTTASGTPASARTMHQTTSFRYAETEALQAVELPYRGGDCGMLVVLPKTTHDLVAVEASVSPKSLADLVARLETRRVRLSLPKWRFTSAFALARTLAAMGMPDAFSDAKADLTGIADPKPLSIQAVMHKAFVAVDEEGTEAAAATGAALGLAAAPTRDPVEMKVDRPFLFAIRHRTGALLFLGRVVDPTRE